MVDSSRYIALALQKERMEQDRRDRNAEIALSLGKSIAGAASGIASQYMAGQRAGQQNSAANTAMNKSDPPRAEAVNPNAPGVAQANQTYGGPSQAHTGGMDELKLDLAMDDNKRRNMAAGLSEQREGRMQQSADDAYSFRLQDQAIRAAKMTDQKTKDMVTASNAYYKNKSVYEKKMAEAQKNGDFEQWDSAATDLQGLHSGTISRGVKLPDLILPTFKPADAPDDVTLSTAVSDWQGRKDRAMQPGGWDGVGDWMNGKTAGEEYMDESAKLDEMKSKAAGRKATPYKPDDNFIPLPASSRSSQGGNAVAQAKQAIAAGADPQAVAARLQAMGIDPTLLNK